MKKRTLKNAAVMLGIIGGIAAFAIAKPDGGVDAVPALVSFACLFTGAGMMYKAEES